jgi:hypothetical protein
MSAGLAVATGIAAGSAYSWTVTPSDIDFTAHASNPKLMGITCTSAAVTGHIPPNPNPVATIRTHTWTGCDMSSLSVTLTATGLPWTVQPTGLTTAGKTPVSVSGVHITLSGPCIATISGNLTGYFDNSFSGLVISNTPTLVVSNVSGLCLGLINNGDPAPYSATYFTSPALQVNNP